MRVKIRMGTRIERIGVDEFGLRLRCEVSLRGMPNDFFRFKQFVVQQEGCAMKVCTDACLFGAWVAARVSPTRVLDIGTGTGLLSLMMAQQHDAPVDAIEIDHDAAEQARSNFAASPWKDSIKVWEGDAKQLFTGIQYDLVISNPPFFDNDLKSADHKRNLALHSSALDISELLLVVEKHLAPAGRFAVLLPWHRKEEMITLATQRSLHVEISADVKQTEKHNYFRTMLLFTKQPSDRSHEAITVKNNGVYSPEFTALLQPYYLHL